MKGFINPLELLISATDYPHEHKTDQRRRNFIMKKQVVNEFAKMRDALSRYEDEIELTLTAYRQQFAAAKQEAALYRDSDGRLSKAKEALVAPARARIAAVDRALAKTAGEVAESLREAIAARVTEQPDAGFVSLLQAYNSLGVKLSPGELRALVVDADGNYASLRMLAATAERNGYRLNVPTADEYEKTVRDIERLTRPPLEFVPMSFVGEGVDVLEDRPRFSDDGRLLYSLGRPDTTFIVMASGAFKALGRRINEAADRWSVDFVPELSELQPIKDTDGRTLMNEEQQRAGRPEGRRCRRVGRTGSGAPLGSGGRRTSPGGTPCCRNSRKV